VSFEKTKRDWQNAGPATEENNYKIKLLSPEDIKTMTGLGKNQVYALMNSAGFPSIRLNSRIFVTEVAFASWLATYEGRTYLF